MSLKLHVEKLVSQKSDLSELKLQLGCGQNILPNWINTDSSPYVATDYLDFTKPFPFSSSIFAAVFCEHTIEHISKAQALTMITEVFRVLRAGGLFRVVT